MPQSGYTLPLLILFLATRSQSVYLNTPSLTNKSSPRGTFLQNILLLTGKKMAGPLLENIYQSKYDEQMRSLLKESKVFGIALFAKGTTIQKVPMMTFWDPVQTTHWHYLI
jgi:hypothetical protein